MEEQLVIVNVKTATVSNAIVVQGKVLPENDSFAINLGQDDSNYLVHFNPRFNESKVIFNSRKDGQFGTEIRDSYFPFRKGENTMVTSKLSGTGVQVYYADGRWFDFKSPVSTDSVKFIKVAGGFELKHVEIK